MKRARSDQQKESRRQTFLDAAQDVLATAPYERITMNQVAESAHLGKATIYSYFETKEALFLALLLQSLDNWLDDLDRHLEALARPSNAKEVAAVICASLERQQTMMRLFPVHPMLERSVQPTSAYMEHKDGFRTHSAQTAKLLEAVLPFLPAGEGVRLIRYIYVLLLGLDQLGLSNGSTQGELSADFTDAFTALLLGLERGA